MAKDPRNDPAERNAPRWIKAFVAFHLIAITIWALPNPPQEFLNGTRPIGIRTDSVKSFGQSLASTLTDGLLTWNSKYGKPSFLRFYTMSTGFWQYWDMFAPNPANTDRYGTATIRYADGTTEEWAYPRVYDLGIFEKYLKERYRKFFERAHDEPFIYLWSPFARRVAELATHTPANPVVQVTLRRHFMVIPPPDQPLPKDYNYFDYFRATRNGEQWKYEIHKADLEWVEARL